ncbi:adenylate/guanylate cyclase domain-containing protein [Cyanobium sp. NIES-981]|uniref:adenylate/guanylate cyclase domain-containing protein n=1 Tax=Cyanobium sp. NIES-981 TaxID=1851505 RepID=UPI0007DCDB08|nr:adenylate/guanylate cyclase domain-containing protein [Cyanobium sp. NIES-981]SBO43791.1 Guanylyl cyclase [Cyanobium sp. NIES-981]
MASSLRRTVALALASGGLALTVGGLGARPPQQLRVLERGLEDQLVRLRGRRPVPQSVVLVAIDDSTLQQGAWFADQSQDAEPIPAWAEGLSTLPWPRARYGDLLDRLGEASPGAVAINVVFEGPSSQGPADDAALAAAIGRQRGRVALAAEVMEIRDTSFTGLSLAPPADLLREAAGPGGLGITNTLPGGQGEAHSHPQTYSERILALAGAKPQPALSQVALERSGRVSRQADARRQLNFYGPEASFERLPAWEVLDPERWRNHPRRSLIRDAVVLIGPVGAQGGAGTVTPFGTLSGLEMLATATANSLLGDGLQTWPVQPLPRGLLALTPVLLVAVLALLRAGLGWRLGLVALVLALQLAGAWLAFDRLNTWVPLLVPATALVLLGALYGGDAYLAEERERRRLRRTFERYVAPSVVAEILSDPAAAEGILRGRLLPVTVLFTDLKGFTQLTNSRSGSGEIELHVRQLNRYLGEMVEVITAHGGTVDKFIGDAVMAVFGSPLGRGPRAEAVAAVRCAAEMRRALSRLNSAWQAEGLEPLDNCTGLASGEVIVGQIGSPRRMEFTVIGDKVNLASRMEGLTRTAGTPLLFDAATAELVDGELPVQPLGELPVKGMGELPVFTLRALPAG